MISNFAASLFSLALLVVVIFSFWTYLSRKPRKLMNRLFLYLSWAYGAWAAIMLLMWLTPADRLDILQILDGLSYIGISTSPLYFLIVYSFTKVSDKLPRWWPVLFVIPVVTIPLCLTNDFHHLQYQVFSLVRSEIIFGPFVMVTGVYSYFCMLLALVQLFRSRVWKQSKLFLAQSILMALGGLCPSVVSLLATFSGFDFSITATPLSYAFLVLFNGIAIYQFNLLDVTPFALQRMEDWANDCYLILGPNGMVLSFNDLFSSVFADRYGILGQHFLRDCLTKDDIAQKTALYKMVSAVDACHESRSVYTYEETVVREQGGDLKTLHYLVEVSQLVVDGENVGTVVVFKDVTRSMTLGLSTGEEDDSSVQ